MLLLPNSKYTTQNSNQVQNIVKLDLIVVNWHNSSKMSIYTND